MKLEAMVASVVTISFAAAPDPIENASAGVFSPDGRYLAFERQDGWDRHLGVMDLESRKVEWVENGPGLAGLASWGSDGSLVYTAGNVTNTAFAGERLKSEDGFGIRIWRRGKGVREFTKGRRRDATPSFSPDMKTLYWVSPEGNTQHRLAQIYMWSAPVDAPERRRRILTQQMHYIDASANQPQVSPDGRLLAWAHLDSIRDRWGIRAAAIGDPNHNVPITEPEASAFEPRWSADGRYLVYTAFKDGDPTWCCYIQELSSGATRNLGPGREPCLSPDMRTLVRTLDGRLVFTPLCANDLPHGPKVGADHPSHEAEKVFFSERPVARRHFSAKATSGFVLGAGRTFFVRTRIRWTGKPFSGDATVISAKYDECSQVAFRLVMQDSVPNFWWLNRDRQAVRVPMPGPLEPGEHEITAVRTATVVYLSVDGSEPILQQMREGHLPLDHPRGMGTGSIFERDDDKRVLSIEVGTGWPVNVPKPATRRDLLS
ncbi:MAG: PD40 domain-containing protein [Kiritimatiellae bacterium]|nr:PD40 domain-containing protein [Kiritimatiellia bacterium]